MTIRQHLNRNLRLATLLCWVAVLASIIAVFATAHHSIRLVGLLMAGLCYGAALYQTFTGRCPRCRTGLLFALGSFGVRLVLPAWFTSCPSCGLSFEAQLDDMQRSNQAMQRTAPRSDA